MTLSPTRSKNTIKLVDEGCTIPFIARYRKEQTGELNDQVLRELYDRLVYLRNLESRKEEVRRLIEEQEKLTDEISSALEACTSMQEVDDIYRPFKPKRRTRASIAREKGLEPLAEIIFGQNIFSGDIIEIAQSYIDPEKGVNSADDALAGAMDIIAEDVSDDAEIRKNVRQLFFKHGVLGVQGCERRGFSLQDVL